ncbi:type I-B CRISPR-associated protein Cas5b [Caldithrix abyssi]
MKVFRIHIQSWTASFRYPNLISGYQATLPVPPLSTLFGLISAAMGRYFYPKEMDIGFVFTFQTKGRDLETIYQMGRSLSGIKSNVIVREFLVDNDLWLYPMNAEVAKSFEKPYFPLLLGRSGDLASVRSIDQLDIEIKKELHKVKGTIIPFKASLPIAAPIHALPIYFTDEIPRRNVGTKPYYLLDGSFVQDKPFAAYGFEDQELGWDVYWQD